MTKCAIAFPCSIGDTVTVYEEPGWTIVGLCESDRVRRSSWRRGYGR